MENTKISLEQLLEFAWHGQNILVKNEMMDILFYGSAYSFFDGSHKNLYNRAVKHFGVMDGAIVIGVV